jgi:hypothetical protein
MIYFNMDREVFEVGEIQVQEYTKRIAICKENRETKLQSGLFNSNSLTYGP